MKHNSPHRSGFTRSRIVFLVAAWLSALPCTLAVDYTYSTGSTWSAPTTWGVASGSPGSGVGDTASITSTSTVLTLNLTNSLANPLASLTVSASTNILIRSSGTGSRSANFGAISKSGAGNFTFNDNTTSSIDVSGTSLNVTLGTVFLGNSGGNIALNSFNISSATTIGSSGTLTAMWVTGGVNLGATTVNGILNVGTNTVTVSSLTGSGTVRYNSSATNPSTGTLSVNGSEASIFNGSLANGGTNTTLVLQKSGSGTLTLNGTNSYSGGTTVSAGTLIVNSGTGNGSVSVLSNGTLGGIGTIAGLTTIAGTHTPGNSPGVQTFTGGLTYSPGANIVWELTSNTSTGRGSNFDGINVSGGPLTLSGNTTTSLVFNSLGSTVDWNNAFWGSDQSWLVFDTASAPVINGTMGLDWSVDINNATLASIRPNASFSYDVLGNDIYLVYSAVPEPSSLALLAMGLAGLSWFRRIRRP